MRNAPLGCCKYAHIWSLIMNYNHILFVASCTNNSHQQSPFS